jgi:flagellar biosynthesis protein FliQ
MIILKALAGGGADSGGRVEADRALNLLNDMLWQCLIVAAPILIATLAIGIVISIFQVATQIQEATLSYVPKLLVAAGLMIVLGPWMMTRVTDFARGLYLAIPQLAG